MRLSVLFVLLSSACHAGTTDLVTTSTSTAAPWESTCAAASAATNLGGLSTLPKQWVRRAMIEGQWVTPPDSGTLAPVEVETRGIVPVLHVRTGAGEKTYAIQGALSTAEGSVGLLLVDESGAPGACAAFVPWATSRLGGAPPAGAWAIYTPGSTPTASIAWYPAAPGTLATP